MVFGLFAFGTLDVNLASGALEFMYIILLSVSSTQDASLTISKTLYLPLSLNVYVKVEEFFQTTSASLFISMIFQV
jgi:hypothetical protein